MRVEKEDTDYRIVLTEEEIKEACTRSVDSLSGLEKFYPWLYAKVEGLEKEVDEVLALCCTGDVFYGPNNPSTHDDIHFEYDEGQPTVRVYTPRLASLLQGEDYLVTRRNAESKIWIHKEDTVPLQL